MSSEKLWNYMVEWCDTPKVSKPGVCYEDCCIRYDNEDEVARQVLRKDVGDVYARVPHSVIVRLRKFYKQTFWGNVGVFKCCQAAQALAKRGLNIVRVFIGLSSGGVGQSLFSSHLEAQYLLMCYVQRRLNKPQNQIFFLCELSCRKAMYGGSLL